MSEFEKNFNDLPDLEKKIASSQLKKTAMLKSHSPKLLNQASKQVGKENDNNLHPCTETPPEQERRVA